MFYLEHLTDFPSVLLINLSRIRLSVISSNSSSEIFFPASLSRDLFAKISVAILSLVSISLECPMVSPPKVIPVFFFTLEFPKKQSQKSV